MSKEPSGLTKEGNLGTTNIDYVHETELETLLSWILMWILKTGSINNWNKGVKNEKTVNFSWRVWIRLLITIC